MFNCTTAQKRLVEEKLQHYGVGSVRKHKLAQITEKTEAWKQAIHCYTPEEVEFANNVVIRSIEPNPCITKRNPTPYFLPANMNSIAQLWAHYVLEHIQKCEHCSEQQRTLADPPVQSKSKKHLERLCTTVLSYNQLVDHVWKTCWSKIVRKRKLFKDACALCFKLLNAIRSFDKYDKIQTPQTRVSRVYIDRQTKVEADKESLRIHLDKARVENELHKAWVKESKENPELYGHLSFDFKRNELLPSIGVGIQPSTTYRASKISWYVFGVVYHGKREEFLVYAYPETVVAPAAADGRKKKRGSAHVVSLIHTTLNQLGWLTGIHPPQLRLDCDNCGGENKNQYLVQYCAWLEARGYFEDVKVHFMVAGHTKFGPDRMFGDISKYTMHQEYMNGAEYLHHVQVSLRRRAVRCVKLLQPEDFLYWNDNLSANYTNVAGIASFHLLHIHDCSIVDGRVGSFDEGTHRYNLLKVDANPATIEVPTTTFNLAPLTKAKIAGLKSIKALYPDREFDYEQFWEEWAAADQTDEFDSITGHRDKKTADGSIVRKYKVQWKNKPSSSWLREEDLYHLWLHVLEYNATLAEPQPHIQTIEKFDPKNKSFYVVWEDAAPTWEPVWALAKHVNVIQEFLSKETPDVAEFKHFSRLNKISVPALKNAATCGPVVLDYLCA
jgi:hypothetical protein